MLENKDRKDRERSQINAILLSKRFHIDMSKIAKIAYNKYYYYIRNINKLLITLMRINSLIIYIGTQRLKKLRSLRSLTYPLDIISISMSHIIAILCAKIAFSTGGVL